MTFYPSSLRARVGITPLHDRSVTFILLGLLALVFAPVLRLHVALAAFRPDRMTGPAERDSIAEPAGPSAKLVRG
jgi:hypothetical protein